MTVTSITLPEKKKKMFQRLREKGWKDMEIIIECVTRAAEMLDGSILTMTTICYQDESVERLNIRVTQAGWQVCHNVRNACCHSISFLVSAGLEILKQITFTRPGTGFQHLIRHELKTYREFYVNKKKYLVEIPFFPSRCSSG